MYSYAQTERIFVPMKEVTVNDHASGRNKPATEVAEYLGEAKGTVIGEIDILEKSMYVEEEIASMDGS